MVVPSLCCSLGVALFAPPLALCIPCEVQSPTEAGEGEGQDPPGVTAVAVQAAAGQVVCHLGFPTLSCIYPCEALSPWAGIHWDLF